MAMRPGDWWKHVEITIGKYSKKKKPRPWTFFQIYVNDFQYLEYLNRENALDGLPMQKQALKAALDHKDKVDPFGRR